MTATPTNDNTAAELPPRACGDPSQLKLAQTTARESKHTGGWRLVRSRDPRGGPDAIAMTRTADFAHSDLNLAGLMLRCAERSFEVLVVLVEPLPPKAKPEVTLGDKTGGLHLTGTVVPPGAAVLLPAEAATLASGPWQRLSEIAVQVRSEQGQTAGVIPLEGLGEAIQTLLVSCAAR